MNRWKRAAFLAIPSLVLGSGYLLSGGQQEEPAEAYRPAVTPTDCVFLQYPDEFLADTEAIYTMRSNETDKITAYRFPLTTPEASLVDPLTIAQKNLIDTSIFPRMAQAGIQSAPIASDGEFLRRVMLDLTGRIPSSAEVEAFTADTNPSKRDAKIDALVGTPEFIDKWTMFIGDIVKNNSRATNINRFTEGRDAFYLYLKDAVSTNKLASPFQGVLRISTTATGGISVVGLRGRYNERGDFLITTTQPNNESTAASSTELFFPHFADGGGYTTQFILYNGSTDQSSSGSLRFFNQTGQTLSLSVR